MKVKRISCIVLAVIVMMMFTYVQPAEAAAYTSKISSFTYDGITIPAYSGKPAVSINGGKARFKSSELTAKTYEKYSKLDSLGRCQTAEACIDKQLMPTENRNDDLTIHPTGWHQKEYSFIDQNYLYNRCHLIGYQLTAENGNAKNLITGTRYLNVEGMLPYENKVASYIKSTGKHVMYRVTPVFKGNNLLATGVIIEAKSVEDKGSAIDFCVFCYNVQPKVLINYATGENKKSVKTYSSPGINNVYARSGGFKVTYRKVKNADGYQIAYKKNSASKYKKVTTGSLSKTVTGLSYKTTYKVKVRSYQVKNGKKVYSKYTSLSSVKTLGKSTYTYMLNTSSMKIHKKGCESISKMAEHNKLKTDKSVSVLLKEGYTKCGSCWR